MIKYVFGILGLLFFEQVLGQTLQEQIKRADDLYYNGQYQEAIGIYEKEVANKKHPRDTTFSYLLDQLAWAYVDESAYPKAEALFTEAKNIREKILGKEHLDYATSCAFLSLVAYYQGQYKKAEPLCIEAKNIREKVTGKNNSSFANSCYNLADIYSAQRMYAKAEPLYLEARSIRKEVLGTEDLNYIKSSYALAILYHDQAKYQQAETYYWEVRELRGKVLGKTDVSYAKCCHDLAILYLEQNKYDQAETLFLEAIQVFKASNNGDNYQLAWSNNSLANLYSERGQYDKAIPFYLEAIAIQEKISGRNNMEYASFCCNLAVVYKEQEMLEKAEDLYLKAKNIQERVSGKVNPDYALTCNNLGGLYAKQGLFAKAENYFEEALGIQEKLSGKENLRYAMYCHNLGSVYLDQGDFPKAESMYLIAKNIREKLLGKQHMEYASTIHSLGNVYTDMGLHSKAEPLYLESKKILESLVGKTHSKYSSSCTSLGNLYFQQELYPKAEALYLEAKSIDERIVGKNASAYAMSCNNLASVYMKQEQYAKAEPLYLEAKNAQEKKLGRMSLEVALSLSNLGSLYRRLGKASEAEKMYLEAKEIREKLLGKEHPIYANTCNNLANLYVGQGAFGKASPLYKEAIANKLKQIDDLLPVLSEKERDEFYRSIDYFFKRYYEFVLLSNRQELYSDLFNIQLRIKGLIFQSTQKMQRQIIRSGNAALIQQYEDWKEKRIRVNKYALLTISDRAKRGINLDSLQTIVNELERSLSKQSETMGAMQDKSKLTWQQVQKKLAANEAAVEIIRTENAYIALVLTATSANGPEAVIFTEGAALDKKYINFYRTSIANKIEDDLSYNHFWLPIQQKLPNINKVYVSGDGVFHQLNLLTLKNPQTKRYVLEEVNVQLLSNVSDLLSNRKEELPQVFDAYKIHVIAYPSYDKGNVDLKSRITTELEKLQSDTSQRFFGRGGEIAMLPGTKVEAGNIEVICKKLHVPSETRLLDQATETYMKSLDNPPIVHIATHGFFVPSSINTANSRSFTEEESAKYSDPLLNSGLLLANAKQGLAGFTTDGEDGVLTAKEALNLRLDKTTLVVMSACETGLGEIRNGEGVYGLQRSFQQAGAKTVINSLWKVSDEATQVLMSSFYSNLLEKKMSKREAFKQAQTALILKYPEPYYWGAFVLIGE